MGAMKKAIRYRHSTVLWLKMILCSQGSGHELYGYPGYGSLLLGSSGLEQNMPPSAGPPATAGLMGGLIFSGAPYHPGYTTHNIQVFL